jgi:hypothetical protein
MCPLCHGLNIKFERKGNVALFQCTDNNCKHIWVIVEDW